MLRRFLLLCAFSLAGVLPASAARVSAIASVSSHGQTFLTWTQPPGTGWTYRVYRCMNAAGAGSIENYTFVGAVGDSTWCDLRLSHLQGTIYPYVLPGGVALNAAQGLFVCTTEAGSSCWYAVTCASSQQPENTNLTAGTNRTGAVAGTTDRPAPVYQRSLVRWNTPFDVYTLWTSNEDSPQFPAMCNRPSWPYDCSIVTGLPAPMHALMFSVHVRGGDFTQVNRGTNTPGEYVLNMDDYLPTSDGNTFWYGYHETYDIAAWAQSTPPVDEIEDYTLRRVIFTLEWARTAFPVDTTRVYAMGASMGGIGAVLLATHRPDLLAATMVNVPLFDLSFESDPIATSGFNLGQPQRIACDHLWGTVDSQLLGPDGASVWADLDANVMVKRLADRFVAPIVAFSGRYDTTLGWAEKPRFYATMEHEHAGGSFFFDDRGHGNTVQAAWYPMMDYAYVYRFRTDRSFPAFSHCSANDDPGDGHSASGDSVGTINGVMDWDTTSVVDQPNVWAIKLSLRDLTLRWGVRAAPESVTVDVTPRRTQQFKLAPWSIVDYSVTRSSDGATLGQGELLADEHGIVTIPNVHVMRGGSKLTVVSLFASGVGPGNPAAPVFSALPNPLRGACALAVAWPRAGPARLDVLDVTGRRVREVFAGTTAPGVLHVTLDPAGLAPGLYFLRASVAGFVATQRVTVLR